MCVQQRAASHVALSIAEEEVKYGKARRPAWRTLAFVWSAIVLVPVARALATLFSRFEFSLASPAMPAALWPPSRESTPFLATVLAASLVACYRVFFRVAQSEAAQAVKAKKARLVLAQLAQTVRMERERAEQERRLAEGGALGGDGGDDAERKVPPTAAALHELLYDTTEERHVTEFGIEALGDGLEDYRRARALLSERLAAELAEGLDKSARADRAQFASEEEAVALDKYRGGVVLRELLKLYTREVRRHFAQPLATRSATYAPVVTAETERLAADARAYLAAIDAEQRAGKHAIVALLLPLMPTYLGGMALFLFESALGPALWAEMFTLLDRLADRTMAPGAFRGVLAATFGKWVFYILAHVVGQSLMTKANSQFALRIRREVMASMLRQDVEFFDRNPSGVLQERLNKDAQELAENLFNEPKMLLRCCAIIVANLFVLSRIDPHLLRFAILPVPVVAAVQFFVIRFMRGMGKRLRKMSEKAAADTAEIIKEVRTVREFAKEAAEAEKFSETSSYRAQIDEYANACNAICFGWPLFLIFMANRMQAMYQGGHGVYEGELTIGVAIQFTVAVQMVSDHLRLIMEVLPRLVKVTDPIERVNELLLSKGRIEPQPGDAPKLTEIRGVLEFIDVDFAVPDKKILSGLSFEIKPGQKVGFCGAAGSGKSTSFNLMKRFYNPTAGTILLDGRPITDYDVNALRRAFSVVGQENVLFSTTIRENILYGLTEAEKHAPDIDARIEDACRKASIWKDINELFPRKLESYVGEKGFKMSGGQKQRLAIARAIIRRPQFLLLDEPTANLDSVNEAIVQEALDAMMAQDKSLTIVTVAHRLTTIKSYDKLIVMNKGAKVEEGPHSELLRVPIEKDAEGRTQRGWYRELWETQHGAGSSGDAAVDHTSRWVAHLEAKIKTLEAKGARDAANELPRQRSSSRLATPLRDLSNTLGRAGVDAGLLSDPPPANAPQLVRSITVS